MTMIAYSIVTVILLCTNIIVVCVHCSNIPLNISNASSQQDGSVTITSEDAYMLVGYGVMCNENGVFLKLGHCLTNDESTNTMTLARCPYFDIKGYDVIQLNVDCETTFAIKIPDNISELNDFMCGPLNRNGLLCKDCIEGFGVSPTSLGYRCSNCTSVWYSIPLYLTVQYLPTTIFYLIILFSNIHLTSSPMSCFIMCFQMFTYGIIAVSKSPLENIIPVIEHTKAMTFVSWLLQPMGFGLSS